VALHLLFVRRRIPPVRLDQGLCPFFRFLTLLSGEPLVSLLDHHRLNDE